MKKIYSVFLLFLLSLFMVACNGNNGGDDNGNDNGGNDNGGNDNGGGDVDREFDLGGIDFIIMVDNALTADPRAEAHERLFRQEKINNIEMVEEKYNVNVVYKSYPSEASWGGARERWIIQQTSLGTSPAHVYELTSYQIGTLATQNAILPLNDLIEKYGNEGYWDDAKKYGEIDGKYYSYTDQYPIADEGLYYNVDLLERYLGEARRNEPAEKWLAGEWDWDAFRAISDELNGRLDENRSVEDGGPQYVMSGRTYNWAYQMIGANGGHLVNPDFTTGFTSEETIAALNFLNELKSEPGMWGLEANVPLNNASDPGFTNGNIAFHNGQSYWIFQANKWLDKDFELGFVPYPKGPNVKEDLSNYYINDVYGKAAYVISSAYSKDLIPPGYEDLMIHDEIIFQIWNDLLYFPPINSETGFADEEEFIDEFVLTRLMPHYGNQASRDAHESIINKSYPDYFYSMQESNNHNEEAYMIKIQDAIINGDVRNKMISLESEVQSTLKEKYRLPDDFYN